MTPSELDRLVDALEPAVAESALVAGVAAAAREDWRAAAWVLSRRWPERWASVERATAPSGTADGFDSEFGDWSPDVA